MVRLPVPAPADDRLTAWIRHRGAEPGPLWTGRRPAHHLRRHPGSLRRRLRRRDAGLRPHRLRHTYAIRLRQVGADQAKVEALLGHASPDTTAPYFRAGAAEQAAVAERVFE
ncbi:site-specific integrase [Micromonospora sp. CPCC 206171]|uniref:site-specific integrase n=1 Tax=Micromonospora sp. CPCC 206171 TaxID=3122405 RepID=UPI002FF29A85